MFECLKFKFEAVEAMIGHKFKNRELLKEACTHGSNKNSLFALPGDRTDNERLEFLGDAALGIVVSEHLFKKMVEFDPGKLTLARSRLISNSACAKYTRFLGLHQHLRSYGRPTESMLANQFEAVAGALWLEEASEAIRSLVFDRCYPIVAALLDMQGSKEILDRYCERIGQAKPVWEYSQASDGVTSTVRFDPPDPGCSAKAGSKEEAEEQAGAALLQRLKERYCESGGASNVDRNYVGALQEKFPGAIEYCELDRTGPAHDPDFVFEVAVRGRVVGAGSGPSKTKKKAKQAAAKDALEKLQ